ncbi:UDP-glucose 4-epimerase GalE [Salinispirillum sp. LH 10-3-1]|uniref:UDP-glucose 4-epimerase n=1 Tax=Salinispirillum sp. LH 10-3-1 TaxID=2952525 RepID=A0AB38YET0_9GAMM
MAKILVTGGAGYIGSHTCLLLLESGYDVVVLDNLSNASEAALRRVQEMTGKTLDLVVGDIRDTSAVRALFAQHSIDSVIHFAGSKAVGESVEQPMAYYDNNVVGTLRLCEVMAEVGCKRIVFSSSATVYGDPDVVPIPETAALRTSNPYGQTKLVIEQMLREIANADPEWRVSLLRYFNPIGAHPSGRIGENPNGIPNNLMPYVTQVAVGKRPHLSVYGNDYSTPDGTGVRDYIHVMDLAAGHIKAVEYLAQHSGADAFNLGTGVGCSVMDVVNTFERVNGVPIPYQIAPRRAGDVASYFADPTKATQLLGWQAKLNLEDMVRDSWAWQSANPNGY